MLSEPVRHEFVTQLFQARNRYRMAMDYVFRPMGITDATWRTLFFLEQQSNGVMQKELAEIMGIEGPTLVRLLDSLESRELVVRSPAPHDRRGKVVQLTASGNALLAELSLAAQRVGMEIMAGISDEQAKACIAVFTSMMDGCERVRQHD